MPPGTRTRTRTRAGHSLSRNYCTFVFSASGSWKKSWRRFLYGGQRRSSTDYRNQPFLGGSDSCDRVSKATPPHSIYFILIRITQQVNLIFRTPLLHCYPFPRENSSRPACYWLQVIKLRRSRHAINHNTWLLCRGLIWWLFFLREEEEECFPVLVSAKAPTFLAVKEKSVRVAAAVSGMFRARYNDGVFIIHTFIYQWIDEACIYHLSVNFVN